jgi:hypothetical protein
MAIFTLALKRATDKLSDAGKRQIGIAAQMAELARQQVANRGIANWHSNKATYGREKASSRG